MRKTLSDLNVIRSYFFSVADSKTANRTYAIKKALAWGKYGKDMVLEQLQAIKMEADKNKEKVKQMDMKEAEARINYHRISHKRKREKTMCVGLSKFDIVYVPTQGGAHYCVIYQIYDDGTATCYPLTTSSERDLKILGNKSWVIKDCGVELFNGSRLSSHATIVNIEDACFFKCTHLSKHTEIDRAVLYFNNQIAG